MTGQSGMELIINGCEISSDRNGIHLSPYQGNFCNLYKISLLNCTIKSTYTDKSGAIESSYSGHQLNSIIKEAIGNNDIEVHIEKTYAGNDYTGKTPVTFEYTYKELVFKDGKLILATGNPNDKEESKNETSTNNNTESNTENNITNNTETSDNLITKTDNKTNIKLETSNGIIPDDTIMNITEIESGEVFEKVKNVLSDIKNLKVFDITLKSGNTEIQPNGKVKISIPIPVDFDDSRLVIYRFEENNGKTEYQVKVANGYATFETDHFSTYILGEKAELSDEKQDKTDQNIEETTTENNNTKLPQTGEETNAFARWLSITIILGIFWLVSMIFIDREKKKMTKR